MTSSLRSDLSDTLYGSGVDAVAAYRAGFTTFIDPSAGTTFGDSSGNTQPAWATSWTAAGNPVHSSTGWDCDGVGDSWSSSGNPGTALDGLTIFVAFTVDLAATGSNEGIIGCRQSFSSVSLGFDSRQRSTDDVVQVTCGDGTGTDAANIITPHTGGVFHSGTFTFDQAGNDEVVVYGDGTLQDTLDLAPLGSIFNTATPLSVARTNGGLNLNGIIHGVVISAALDAATIAGLHSYFAGVAGV